MRPALLACLLLCLSPLAYAADPEPRDLIQAAMDHWRGTTSYSEMTMTIHRPDWERSMSMRGWTEGGQVLLDACDGAQQGRGQRNPARRQEYVDLLAQGEPHHQGAFFDDEPELDGQRLSRTRTISRSTDIIDQYDHTLSETREKDGHTEYVIISIPHEEAAVVWGKEVWSIRDDYVLLRQEFWDQDDVLVKVMETREIAEMGGRTVAKIMRISKQEVEGEWTEMIVEDTKFDVELPPNVFTLSNLRNPRQ